MDRIYIGKVITTHGVKGEICIRSDFEYKDKAFKIGNMIKIGERQFKINSYRRHKDYEMITLDGITNLNEVIPFKGLNCYIERSELSLDKNEYLTSDLVGYKISNDLGEVVDYELGNNPLLVVSLNNKNYFIPIKGNFIRYVDKDNMEVIVSDDVKGLIL